MKTKTIELYDLDELPADVRAKVIGRERNINVEGFEWYDFLFEEWTTKLEEMGFSEPNISFTGFWCQGDGASFTCKSVDVPLFLAKQNANKRFPLFLKAAKKGGAEVNASVDRIDHHYSHENTVTVNIEAYDEEGYTLPQTLEVTYFMKDTVRALSRQIYRQLEEEYNGLTSDEAVIDTIKANEYTFTANGRMEND